MLPRPPPFIFPTLPATWFIGHMSKALKEMQLMIQSQRVDLLIETRDARLPLTSLNPAFEQILDSAGGKGSGMAKRLIVYNKADLAQEEFQEVSGGRTWFRRAVVPNVATFLSGQLLSAFAAGPVHSWKARGHLHRFEVG